MALLSVLRDLLCALGGELFFPYYMQMNTYYNNNHQNVLTFKCNVDDHETNNIIAIALFFIFPPLARDPLYEQ